MKGLSFTKLEATLGNSSTGPPHVQMHLNVRMNWKTSQIFCLLKKGIEKENSIQGNKEGVMRKFSGPGMPVTPVEFETCIRIIV